jgi:Protein of unknown function (DUF1570)
MGAVGTDCHDRLGCTRRSALLLLGAGVAHCLAGCDGLRLFSLTKPEIKLEKDPAKAAAMTLPGKNQFRVAPYVFFHDFELKHDHPVFRDLEDLRDHVYKELHLPSGTAVVKVYLFENEERYDRFMRAKYPDLPHRRAFFMVLPTSLGGENLVVYAVWGERIQQVQQDLRHELTHALLNSVLKNIPIWLDEGLAEYFELPTERQGVNTGHLEMLRHPTDGPLKLDLARLEAIGSTEVEKMNRPEYREAWAWVHLMLRSKPEAKTVLITYLQQLRTARDTGPILPKLAEVFPSPEEALATHLAQLEEAEPTIATGKP